MTVHPSSPGPWSDPREQAKTEQAKRRLFVAGQVATWVWIVVAAVPLLGVLACCGLCAFGGVLGAGAPDPTFSPYP